MLPTLGVRWFIKSTLLKDIIVWFQLGEMKPEEQYMYIVSRSTHARIQEISQHLKAGGFWSSHLNEFLA